MSRELRLFTRSRQSTWNSANGAIRGRVNYGVHIQGVNEETTFELVCERAVFKEFSNLPVQALDGDARVGPDLPLATVGTVGGAYDDSGVADGCNRALAGLKGPGEEVVEVAPATPRFEGLFHVVWF